MDGKVITTRLFWSLGFVMTLSGLGCLHSPLREDRWVQLWPPEGTPEVSDIDVDDSDETRSPTKVRKEAAQQADGEATRSRSAPSSSGHDRAAANAAPKETTPSGSDPESSLAAQDARLTPEQLRLLAEQLASMAGTASPPSPGTATSSKGLTTVASQSGTSPAGTSNAGVATSAPAPVTLASYISATPLASTSAPEGASRTPASKGHDEGHALFEPPTLPTNALRQPASLMALNDLTRSSLRQLAVPSSNPAGPSEVSSDGARSDPKSPDAVGTLNGVAAKSSAPSSAESADPSRNTSSTGSSASAEDSQSDTSTNSGNTAESDRSPPSPEEEGKWQRELESATASLERELTRSDIAESERRRLQATLRLLYAAAGKRDEAVRPIEGMDPSHQQFWKMSVAGFYELLDPHGPPIMDRRAKLALRYLRDAVQHLGAASSLDVRNLAICRRVDSFGQYEEFDPYVFRPEQEVILYVEVSNFAVEPKDGGFETELQGSYQILDELGHRLADYELMLDRQTCRNVRTDYFLPYRIFLPKTFGPGRYKLQVTIEDKKGKKFGQTPPISFEIRA